MTDDDYIKEYMDSDLHTEHVIITIENALRIKFPGIRVASVNHNMETGKLEFSIYEGPYTIEQIEQFLDEVSGRANKNDNNGKEIIPETAENE